jgi:hypothetical protein
LGSDGRIVSLPRYGKEITENGRRVQPSVRQLSISDELEFLDFFRQMFRSQDFTEPTMGHEQFREMDVQYAVSQQTPEAMQRRRRRQSDRRSRLRAEWDKLKRGQKKNNGPGQGKGKGLTKR